MQLPLTILVAGNSENQTLSPELINAFKDALNDVANLAHNNPVRILTGIATAIEQTAITIAGEQHWPLHILIPDVLKKGDPTEQKAERLVALGISGDNALPEMANKIRDELALAFADLLVVVGDETQFKQDGRLSHLLITAAISRKPLLWLNLQGLVTLLDVVRLNQGDMLLLNADQPDFELIKHCFVELNANNEKLKAQLYPIELAINNQQKLTPQLKKLNAYYDKAKWNPSGKGCYWGPVKPEPEFKVEAAKHWYIFALLARCSVKVRSIVCRSVEKKKVHKSADLILAEKRVLKNWPSNKKLNSVSQFERFDASSNSVAKWHRLGVWILYGFASLAILSAIAGAIHFLGHEMNEWWGGFELLLLVSIVVFLFVQKNQDWHGRWIAERFMAEQLRYLRMGLPLFAIPKIFTEPVWHVVTEANDAETTEANKKSTRNNLNNLLPLLLERVRRIICPNYSMHIPKTTKTTKTTKTVELRSAELWFLQKILHVEGLPQMQDQDKKVYSLAGPLDFNEYVAEVVKDQIKYHENTKRKTHRMHQLLHFLSLCSFVVTMIAVLAHGRFHDERMLFLTIGLPAVAAAFYGIGTKLELTRIANQSKLTLINLGHAKSSLAKLKEWKSNKTEMANGKYWLHVRDLTLSASHVMSDENVQWQSLIEGQKPELPG